MAETVQLEPVDTGTDRRAGAVRRSTSNRPPNRSTNRTRRTNAELIATKGYGVVQEHKPGHDAVRRGPEKTLKAITGEVIKLEGPPKFSQELVAHFTQGLEKDLEGLINMRETLGNYDAFAQLLRDSGHEYYLPLFEHLTKEKEGTNGRVRDVDVKALKEFMSKDSNLEIAVEIAQKRLQEEAMAEAITLSIGPSDGRHIDYADTEMVGEEDISLTNGNIGNRAARRFGRWWRTPLSTVNGREDHDSWARRELRTRGGATTGLGLASAVAGAIGSSGAAITEALQNGANINMSSIVIAGLATAVLPEAVAGIRQAFKRGETMNLTRSAEGILTIQGGPNPQAMDNWMRQMHGVAPSDYLVRGGNVVLREDRPHESRINREELRNRLVSEAKAILDYQEANGVPANLRRPDTATWIFDGANRPPQHGTDFERKTMEAFNKLGGLVDVNGEKMKIPDPTNPGTWIDNPYYRPVPINNSARPGVDVIRSMRILQQAETNALSEMVDTALQDIIDGKTDYRQNILDDIQKLRGGSGNEAQNKQAKERHEKKKVALEGDKTTLTGMSDTLGDFQTSLVISQMEVSVADQEAQDAEGKVKDIPSGMTAAEALRQVLNVEGSGVKITIDGQEIGSLVAEGRKLEKDLRDRIDEYIKHEPVHLAIDRLDKEIAEAKKKAEATRAAKPPNALPGSYESYNQSVALAEQAVNQLLEQRAKADENLSAFRQTLRDELRNGHEFEEQFKSLDEQKALVRELRQEIIEARHNASDKQRDASRGELPGQEEAKSTVKAMSSAFSTIKGIGGLTENQLRGTSGETYTDLEKIINGAATTDPAAWPAGENNDAANRRLLLQAMAEARARQGTLTSNQAIFTTVTDALSDVDILKLSSDQIRDRLGATPPSVDEIDKVKSDIEGRMKKRQAEVKKLIKETERELKKGPDLTSEKLTPAHLDALQGVVTNYGGIREGIMSLNDTSPGGALDQFLSVELIDTVPNSPEWKKGRTVAEDNIYKLLFAKAPRSADHKDASGTVTHGPQGADKIQQDVLDEKQLVKLMTQRFGLQFPKVYTPPGPGMSPELLDMREPATMAEVIGLIRNGFRTPENKITTGWTTTNTGMTDIEIAFAETKMRPFTVTRGQLASFLTETVIFGHLAPQVKANV